VSIPFDAKYDVHVLVALEVGARKIAYAAGGWFVDDVFQLEATAHELMVEGHRRERRQNLEFKDLECGHGNTGGLTKP